MFNPFPESTCHDVAGPGEGGGRGAVDYLEQIDDSERKNTAEELPIKEKPEEKSAEENLSEDESAEKHEEKK